MLRRCRWSRSHQDPPLNSCSLFACFLSPPSTSLGGFSSGRAAARRKEDILCKIRAGCTNHLTGPSRNRTDLAAANVRRPRTVLTNPDFPPSRSARCNPPFLFSQPWQVSKDQPTMALLDWRQARRDLVGLSLLPPFTPSVPSCSGFPTGQYRGRITSPCYQRLPSLCMHDISQRSLVRWGHGNSGRRVSAFGATQTVPRSCSWGKMRLPTAGSHRR
ncbi:hypothetical protein VTI74DRAFT_1114 [Chaetomium olivicolor]